MKPDTAILLLNLGSDVGMRPYAILTQDGAWTDAFRRGTTGGFTYPAANPKERRDVILFHGALNAGEGSVLNAPLASTHRPVTVRFIRP